MDTRIFTVRLAAICLVLLAGVSESYAQTSLAAIDFRYGPYTVGFRHYVAADSSRTYRRVYDYTNEVSFRPIPVSVWYPATPDDHESEVVRIGDYLTILKEEEEWEHLPREQILNWFYYANTPENRRHLEETTRASRNAPREQGKFPLIVYAPSFQASSVENFGLCEYLASHGFVVIAGPSRGTETQWFGDNYAKEMETQARDVEFLLRKAGRAPFVDRDRVALMGFSFGGLANLIVQNRNDRIAAVISLDGTERYQYDLLKGSPFFAPQNVDVPYLHLAQKEIPEAVLIEDNIDSVLNTRFKLYDSISRGDAYKLRFHHLTHGHFSTLGVLFAARDRRQDKTDAEIMASHKLVGRYVLQFARATLVGDERALAFLDAPPEANGIGEGLIYREAKRNIPRDYTFQDFNDAAAREEYKTMLPLYRSVQEAHPQFRIPEGHLNTLGLQLVFNPATPDRGIRVFQFATQLYPNSANLYDSLAEGYLFLGDRARAIASFKKSLELNPANQNAIARLAELKK